MRIKKILKTRNGRLLVAAIVLIILGGAALAGMKFFSGEDSWVCSNGQWVKHGNPSAPMPASGCGTAAPTGTPLRSPITKENLILESPLTGDEVNFPFTIKGQARVFENVVSLRVKDTAGQILFESFVMANSPDVGQFGPFEDEVSYFFVAPKNENAFVEVFWNSPKDGSEMDVISVPIKLHLGETSVIKAYFNNSKFDPEASCNKVFPLERIIPKTQSVARKALETLLDGINLREHEAGYFTSLNTGIKINGLTISGDTAKADFDETLQQGVGGSCMVSAIRAQITQTLKQFPTVKNVIISINGRTEDILQP